MDEIRIKRMEPLDEEVIEEWERSTEDEVLGVSCSRSDDEDWPWQVTVSVMEFIRSEPLESELVAAITSALGRVSRVRKVHHEDREAWVVGGDPAGSDLVQAVAEVVDQFASRTRAAVAELSERAHVETKARPWWRIW